MKEAFIEHAFNPDNLQKIVLVNKILAEYAAEGYDLTLRQLYYQMVARGHIENSENSYKKTGELVSNARLAGLVDWAMITDRGRETVTPPHWNDPAQIVEAAAKQFAIDKWEDQPNYVEVMVEKQALEGILIPVCRELDIRFAANKGYSSSSALYETGKRLLSYARLGKSIWILYLGDHDPSGIDMTRDVLERLGMFSGVEINVQRLALNYDQIEDLNPPENPAKQTDARYRSYAERYGKSSWELDAIEPRSLAAIVTEAVDDLLIRSLWDEAVVKENLMRAELQAFASTYRKNGNGHKE